VAIFCASIPIIPIMAYFEIQRGRGILNQFANWHVDFTGNKATWKIQEVLSLDTISALIRRCSVNSS